MKIELFLDGRQVEIDKDIDFVLNKQYTDLSDLTSIIVDYSKTIKVPMSPYNNELFNFVYKLEHQVFGTEDSISYDPSQKIPMTMTYNGSTVMDGYAVLNSIDVKGKSYEINLYGQLGHIFSKLKEKPLNKYTTFSNGWSKYVKMCTYNVAKSFRNANHSLDWNSTDWIDFFGFAPQLYGKSDTIDTKKYEEYSQSFDGEVKNFVDIINQARGIDYADLYVKDGFDFNQYREMRTYMTRPYVYVDKIIQLVKEEINSGGSEGVEYDGYTMTLDPDWFNSDNPYYKDMCYFPATESPVQDGESGDGLVSWSNAENYMTFPTSFQPTVVSSNLSNMDYSYSVDANGFINITPTDPQKEATATIALNCDGIIIRDRITGVGDTSGFDSNGRWAFYNLDKSYLAPIRYIGIYDKDNKLIYKLYLCDNSVWSTWYHSLTDRGALPYDNLWGKLKNQDSRNRVPNDCAWSNGSSSHNYCELTQVYNFGRIVLNTNRFKFTFGCDVINLNSGSVVTPDINRSAYKPLHPFKSDKFQKRDSAIRTQALWEDGATWAGYFRPVPSMAVSKNTYRSLSLWCINDILGDDFNPFTWLIDYAKRFRLFFDINYDDKTINLKGGYFNTVEYKKVEVDYSKGFKVEPIIDKYKMVDYGYPENKTRKGKKYSKSHDWQYGECQVDTTFRISTDTLHLTPNKDDNVFVPERLNALYYDNLKQPSSVPIKTANLLFTNRMINTLNDKGEIEYFPFYAFRWPNTRNPIQPMVPFYTITDDSPQQRNTGEYCYLGTGPNPNDPTGPYIYGWNNLQEDTEVDGGTTQNVYYAIPAPEIPQFDNYIYKTVEIDQSIFGNRRNVRGITPPDEGESEDEGILAITPEDDGGSEVENEEITVSYVNPVTQRPVIHKVPRNGYIFYEDLDEDDPEEDPEDDEPVTQTIHFWVTFGVPDVIYNGYVTGVLDNYCIYDRWKNYLNEIFNVNNKKVTCYVKMSYPEFINFKFNQLFVIDNCTFLVNKIIDFNPNSSDPTQVELIQISDVNNLK